MCLGGLQEGVRQSRSSRATHARLLGDGSFAAGCLQPCCTALLLESLHDQKCNGLGTWGAVQNIQTKKRGRLQPARALCVQHHDEGGCGMPRGMVNLISGKKCESKFPSTLLAVGTSSAPRGEARVSGIDRDFCAFIFCVFIHLKETWHPNRDREIRGKFEKARRS